MGHGKNLGRYLLGAIALTSRKRRQKWPKKERP